MPPLVTVVLPAFEEGKTIKRSITRLINELDSANVAFEARVILDGPDPIASRSLREIEDERLQLIELTVNSGKGSAIRKGCHDIQTEFVAFVDADLDIRPSSLVSCLRVLMLSDNPRIVCAYGSKFHPDSRVAYPVIRTAASKIFRQLVRMMFGFDCNDTQTGVKVFRTPELNTVISDSRETRFLFDVELLWLLHRKGLAFTEAPVTLDYQYSSTITLRHSIQMLFDLLSLRLRSQPREAQR